MILSSLTNEELLRHAQAQHDELTATPIETELLRRFGQVADEMAALQAVADVLDNVGLSAEHTADIEKLEKALSWLDDCDPDTYRPLFDVLTARDIDDAKTLEQILERDSALQDVLADLADPMGRLTALITPTN